MRRLIGLTAALLAVLIMCSGCTQTEEPQVQTPDALTEVNRLVDLFVGPIPDAPGYQASVLHELQSMLLKLDEKGMSGRLLTIGEKQFVKAQSIVVEMDNGDVLICLTKPGKQDASYITFCKGIEEEAEKRALKTAYVIDDYTDRVHYVVMAKKPSDYARNLYRMANSAPDRPPVEDADIPDFD